MLVLQSQITTTNSKFDAIVSVEIDSSWENLVDTAKFVIPKNIFRSLNQRGIAAEAAARFAPTLGNNTIMRRGDTVKIELGYKDNMTTRFEGFISNVGSRIPVEIQCEDNMWKLKQTPVKKAATFQAGTLSSLLTQVLPDGYPFQCEDISIGKFDIKGRVTVAEFLDYLKRSFGFSVWIADGVLHVGLAYTEKSIADFVIPTLPVFDFQRNIIEDDLQFVNKDDISFKVTVTNIKPDNSRKTFEFGDPAGELRTYNFYDMADGDIKKMADDIIARHKYTGFRGSFTGFLDPPIRHGDAVRINDDIIKERSGVYLVKHVRTSSGIAGGRQVITLDQKLS